MTQYKLLVHTGLHPWTFERAFRSTSPKPLVHCKYTSTFSRRNKPALELPATLQRHSSVHCVTGQGHHPCRTWDRGDLLRRLHSFKSSTWFCKPPGAGPMECARRGWVNHSMDMLSCEVGLQSSTTSWHQQMFFTWSTLPSIGMLNGWRSMDYNGF